MRSTPLIANSRQSKGDGVVRLKHLGSLTGMLCYICSVYLPKNHSSADESMYSPPFNSTEQVCDKLAPNNCIKAAGKHIQRPRELTQPQEAARGLSFVNAVKIIINSPK
jgi:hypothetical protein